MDTEQMGASAPTAGWKQPAKTVSEEAEPMAISASCLKNCIIEIKPASALKKLSQLPINRGSEGLLPSVNTL